MAETQKQRIDRIREELDTLSDTVEALALLRAFPGTKIIVMLVNPADPQADILATATVNAAGLASLVQAEIDWRLAALNQDHVQL